MGNSDANKRMWINQPSTSQQYHHLHGKRVLMVTTPPIGYSSELRWIYFTENTPSESQLIHLSALSTGWPEDGKLLPDIEFWKGMFDRVSKLEEKVGYLETIERRLDTLELRCNDYTNKAYLPCWERIDSIEKSTKQCMTDLLTLVTTVIKPGQTLVNRFEEASQRLAKHLNRLHFKEDTNDDAPSGE